MAISAMEAAKIACQASGWNLSNLQLHKILYLAHLVYAGHHGGEKLIMDEPFQAWAYGPVLPNVYHQASRFGSGKIQDVFPDYAQRPADDEGLQVIQSAVRNLSNVEPFRLVQITHEAGGAWDKAYKNGQNTVISQSDVNNEYQQRFTNQ